MLKKEIRQLYINKRKKLGWSQKDKWDDLLLIQFQKLPLPFLSCVLSFYPMEEKKEINTFLLTDYLLFTYPGLQIAYPKIESAGSTMQAWICNEDTVFELNKYNIPEPTNCELVLPQHIDLVIIPMLAFDKKGHRVGYGKGYYDAFLHNCREDCIKVGVCYFEPVDTIEDAHQFDVPLSFCITPQKSYVF